jgi:excisionase family DNA binding protein
MNARDFKFLTIKQAAAALGVQYWKVQRAVQRGDIPHYTLFNTRKLVLLDDILKIVQQTSTQNTDHAAEPLAEGTLHKSEERARELPIVQRKNSGAF